MSFAVSQLYLDSNLPNGVLESLETELLWEKCLADYGEVAWVRWSALYRVLEEKKGMPNEVTEKSDCRF